MGAGPVVGLVRVMVAPFSVAVVSGRVVERAASPAERPPSGLERPLSNTPFLIRRSEMQRGQP